MMDKYGLDTRSLQYNPDRQAPIVSEESGPPKRRCVII